MSFYSKVSYDIYTSDQHVLFSCFLEMHIADDNFGIRKSREDIVTTNNDEPAVPCLDGTYDLIRVDKSKSKVVFGSHLISIEPQRNPNESIYRRFEAGKLVVEQVLSISNNDYTISFIPIPPVNMPSNISDHVMLKFTMPVVIDAGGQLLKYCTMPIELAAIRKNSVSSKISGIIDKFSLGSPTYALYGEPHNGLITRFANISLYDSLDEVSPRRFEQAKVEVSIINGTNTSIKVNRIVLPASQMSFFYDNNDDDENSNNQTVYLESLEMDIQSNLRAIISLLNKSPRQSAIPVPAISNFSEREKFEMKRGVFIA